MVRMINIGRDDHYIWCDYIPEGKEKPGFIKIDINTDKIIQIDASPYEDETGIRWYSHHAKRRLIKIKNATVLPEKDFEIWY